jgi:hypothetical protein
LKDLEPPSNVDSDNEDDNDAYLNEIVLLSTTKNFSKIEFRQIRVQRLTSLVNDSFIWTEQHKTLLIPDNTFCPSLSMISCHFT